MDTESYERSLVMGYSAVETNNGATVPFAPGLATEEETKHWPSWKVVAGKRIAGATPPDVAVVLKPYVGTWVLLEGYLPAELLSVASESVSVHCPRIGAHYFFPLGHMSISLPTLTPP
jgi:hypothetical protein